jgi:glycerol kinase
MGISGRAGRHVLSIDQGTTGSTVLVMGASGETLGRATREFPQHFPRPGWVEHEPEELWGSVLDAIEGALRDAAVPAESLCAIGITNQRETTLLWERASLRAVHRAVVWQDRRTSALCAELEAAGHGARVREVTGLVIDPYFSGSKLRWLLSESPELARDAGAGKLAFGTVDSYLVERLTGGARERHVIEVTNASRTLLMDLASRRWSAEMCELWQVPEAILPDIVPSAGVVGTTRGVPGLPDGLPIAGIAGDQQAALFGQGCFQRGDAKCTYGTGAFVLVNTGSAPTPSQHGLLSTLGWQIGEEVTYALEGACFVAGAAVQWLRDGLGIVGSAAEIEELARSVPASDGVVFVPALAGLGAPYWDPEARGLLTGLTRGTTRAHIARATLEAIALQVDDLLRAMGDDLGAPVRRMRVDGGAAANDLLMQLQADYSGVSVQRPPELESTARGAAMLAAIGVGLHQGTEQARAMLATERTFEPGLDDSGRTSVKDAWSQAVGRARSRH